MNSSSVQTGSYDFYIYGDDQAELAIVAGFGGSGQFHYWNGGFVDTDVSYEADTWYRVEIAFDTAADTYDFRVFDTSGVEIVRVEEIDFGNAVSDGVDQVKLRTSVTYSGKAYADDVWARPLPAVAPVITMSEEKTTALTDAWVRHEQVIPFLFNGTMRWKVTAVDTSGNETESEIFSHRARSTPLLDAPPTLNVISPSDDTQQSASPETTTAPITFHATCADERGVAEIALHGSWHESPQPVAVHRPATNVETQADGVFAQDVPVGEWEWYAVCADTSGNTTESTPRRLLIGAPRPAVAQAAQAQAADEVFATPAVFAEDRQADVLNLIMARFQRAAAPLVAPVQAVSLSHAARPLRWAVLPGARR